MLYCVLEWEGGDNKAIATDEAFLRTLYVVCLEIVLFVHGNALRGLNFTLQLMQISAWYVTRVLQAHLDIQASPARLRDHRSGRRSSPTCRRPVRVAHGRTMRQSARMAE